jgi:type IV secretion system protein VirB10
LPGQVMSVKLQPPPQQQPQPLTAVPILTGSAHPNPYTLMGIPPYGLSAPVPRPSEGAATPGPRQRAFDRRLSGPVFATQSDTSGSPTPLAGVAGPLAVSGPAPSASDSALVSSAASVSGGASRSDSLAELLAPSSTPAALARVLPTRSLLLPKGAFIDCTLETAIDSTLPGMTTCITATDTFGADGTVVLLERGSKLIGETRGEVQQGSARIFVLWTEARTPTGVVIPLASPGTDELGRSGLAGAVNRHFWERFGAAILVSIIDAGAESAVQSGNGTVIYDPTATQDVTTEVLKDTLHIPPTVVKSQGDRIQVLVARDLDFRSVYELRAAAER